MCNEALSQRFGFKARHYLTCVSLVTTWFLLREITERTPSFHPWGYWESGQDEKCLAVSGSRPRLMQGEACLRREKDASLPAFSSSTASPHTRLQQFFGKCWGPNPILGVGGKQQSPGALDLASHTRPPVLGPTRHVSASATYCVPHQE